MTSATRFERAWLVAAGAAVAAAIAARIHGAFTFPAMNDFDAPGHLLNAMSIHAGHLAPVHSWLGFHPPLYHAVSALLWWILPVTLPVHVEMRLLSAAAGFGAAFVVWRTLRANLPAADAAVLGALLVGTPVFGLAATMVGNETSCALFSTLLLASLTVSPSEDASLTRRALATGLVGALAALCKSTGWLAVAIAAATWALRLRARPRVAFASLIAIVGLPLLLAGPFYVRVALGAHGSPMGFVSGAALSPDLALMMSRQPPGERHLADYFSIPASTFLRPRFDQPGMLTSVPGLLYASIWADGHGHYIWLTDQVRPVASVVTIGGLLPTGLALFGVIRMLRRRRPGDLPALAFGGLLLVSLLRYAWILPHYSAIKASYLLPAMLPAALAVGAAVEAIPVQLRPALRVALLLLSLAGTGLTIYGWWWWPVLQASQ